MNQQFYQVGGSLPANSKSYIKRDADDKLYKYLKEGKYCYVLNARQVGKSSLRVHTSKRLEDEGYSCVNIDLTSIGSEDITVDEWYFSFVLHIVEELGLDEDEFVDWWDENDKLTVINRFSKIFDKFILKNTDKKVIIFIDEVDSILGSTKEFSANDFFAVIRTFYNLRSEDKRYNRVSFALFGVATPEDLMRDSARTPFNIAHQVNIKSFNLSELSPLIEGVNNQKIKGEDILERVFEFTSGTPYLTQKLLDYISNNPIESLDDINQYVDSVFIKENFQETNLSNIQNRIISNEKYNLKMLTIINQLLSDIKIKADGRDITQIYLKLSGLVKEEKEELVFTNQIYRMVFNKKWLFESLNKIDRPFMKDLQRWLELKRVDSALISGEVLVKANKWAEGRDDLTVDENTFLQSSFRLEKENELKEEKKKAQRKQIKNLMASLLVSILIGGGLVYFYLESKKQEKKAIQKEKKAIQKEKEALKQKEKANKFKEEAHAFALKIKKIESDAKIKKYDASEKSNENNDSVILVVPDETQVKYPNLVKLIIASKSMNNSERNYWLQVLPVMTTEQVAELRDILATEKRKLAEIDVKYSKMEHAAKMKEYASNPSKFFKQVKSKKNITDSDIDDLLSYVQWINKKTFPKWFYKPFLKNFELIKERVESKDKYFHLLARFYLQTGHYDKALNCAEKSIKINPNNYEVYVDMAKVYQAKKDYKETITFYEKAMRLVKTLVKKSPTSENFMKEFEG